MYAWTHFAALYDRYIAEKVAYLEECFCFMLSIKVGGERTRDKAAFKMCKERLKASLKLWFKQAQN